MAFHVINSLFYAYCPLLIAVMKLATATWLKSGTDAPAKGTEVARPHTEALLCCLVTGAAAAQPGKPDDVLAAKARLRNGIRRSVADDEAQPSHSKPAIQKEAGCLVGNRPLHVS